MGVFGVGLYSSDSAMDLRAMVGAVLRLPFDEDTLVDILCGTDPSAADSPSDENHTTFWLVLADQFAKRQVASDRVRSKALDIIDTRVDLTMLEKLGMKPGDLRKRQRTLDDLRARILAAPKRSRIRRVLRKPEPLLMAVGDVMVYPTCRGDSINPYFASKELQRVNITERKPWTSAPWKQDGWGAIVILDCGRAFDYLAWYRPATLAEARTDKPTVESLRGQMLWRVRSPGTCSASHFRKMELETIGVFPVNRTKANDIYPRRFGTGQSAAVRGGSIVDAMRAALPGTAIPNPGGEQRIYPPTLSTIEEVLES